MITGSRHTNPARVACAFEVSLPRRAIFSLTADFATLNASARAGFRPAFLGRWNAYAFVVSQSKRALAGMSVDVEDAHR